MTPEEIKQAIAKLSTEDIEDISEYCDELLEAIAIDEQA